MGKTLFQKIIYNKTRDDSLKVGDLVEVNVDRLMIHDFFIPFCVNKFKEMGFSRVFDPQRLVFVYDHLVPATFIEDYRHHKMGDDFARQQGMKNVHRSDGVCHQLLHEQGYVNSGDIVLGTDSHTVTYGAVSSIATGIGYTEMAAAMGTGKLWLKIVPSIKITVNGRLRKGVTSKDIILKVLGDIKTDGATYKSLEFSGSTISQMSMDSRFTLSNMSVEAGAKTGLIETDEKTRTYLSRHYPENEITMFQSDADAEYEREIVYQAEEIPALVACPHNVDQIKTAAELADIEIDQAFLGSCTNGRLEDLGIAAQILKGKKIDPRVRFIIVPASRQVYQQAIARGYVRILAEAGAMINHPSCGLCAGRSGGILAQGERIISSNNRNFLGRMGSNQAEIYLGSPAVVAASALKGRITDPETAL